MIPAMWPCKLLLLDCRCAASWRRHLAHYRRSGTDGHGVSSAPVHSHGRNGAATVVVTLAAASNGVTTLHSFTALLHSR